MNTSKTLGAYYQVYNNKKATSFVLERFRKYYPDSPIMMISDGGEDFSDLASRYNTDFVHLHNIFGKNDDTYYDSSRMIEGWRRHKLAVENANTDYIMILEDDVLVQDKVEFDDFSFKGATINPLPNIAINIIRENEGWVSHGRYGACGGSVYSSSDFLEVFSSALSFTENHHDDLLQHPDFRGIGAIDLNLVFHFNRMGKPYENAEWLAQKRLHANWENFPIVHQYKEHY
tara:strand:- start:10400 stop:11092 length:693 start_codon:yes stop_codon:yes gene_type:complete